jgi:hypothetical protein
LRPYFVDSFNIRRLLKQKFDLLDALDDCAKQPNPLVCELTVVKLESSKKFIASVLKQQKHGHSDVAQNNNRAIHVKEYVRRDERVDRHDNEIRKLPRAIRKNFDILGEDIDQSCLLIFDFFKFAILRLSFSNFMPCFQLRHVFKDPALNCCLNKSKEIVNV